jgi:hypothetical protein
MTTLIQFVRIYAPYIYAVCGMVALYQIYRTWQVRGERRQAVFSLEREKAVRELYSIFSTAMLLLVIMGITYFVGNTLAAVNAQPLETLPTATPTLELGISGATPTYTPLPPTETPIPTNTAPPVPPTTVPVTPEPTVVVTPAPAVQAIGCSDGAGNAVIQSPGNGQSVQGVVNVSGTATREGFKFYKVEVAPAGTENWSYLDGGDAPVVGGFLVAADTSVLANASYALRLAVVDNTGNFVSCQVVIQVQN